MALVCHGCHWTIPQCYHYVAAFFWFRTRTDNRRLKWFTCTFSCFCDTSHREDWNGCQYFSAAYGWTSWFYCGIATPNHQISLKATVVHFQFQLFQITTPTKEVNWGLGMLQMARKTKPLSSSFFIFWMSRINSDACLQETTLILWGSEKKNTEIS